MSSESVRTGVLGHESAIRYSRTWAGYSLVAMRVAIGWVFFNAGVSRLVDPTWSANEVFLTVRPENPLAGLWHAVGHSLAWLLGPLIVWGLSLVGAAIIFGVAVRLSALLGAAIMTLLWATSLPLSDALLVDEHVVYVFVLFGLGAFGAGRIAGLDAYFESHPMVQERPWLLSLLG